MREVGLAGQRAVAGEFGDLELDQVVALGAGLANTSSCLLGTDGGVGGLVALSGLDGSALSADDFFLAMV